MTSRPGGGEGEESGESAAAAADVQCLPVPQGSFTKVPNEWLEALASGKLRGVSLRVLIYVARKTWGWNKTTERIGQGELARHLETSCQSAARALRTLIARGYLVRVSPHVPKRGLPAMYGLRLPKELGASEGTTTPSGREVIHSPPSGMRGGVPPGMGGGPPSGMEGGGAVNRFDYSQLQGLKPEERNESNFSKERAPYGQRDPLPQVQPQGPATWRRSTSSTLTHIGDLLPSLIPADGAKEQQ